LWLLEERGKCLQRPGSENWVVEWDAGSVLEMNEENIAKKIGRPIKYWGMCKSDRKFAFRHAKVSAASEIE
jgi:hypothetical protein